MSVQAGATSGGGLTAFGSAISGPINYGFGQLSASRQKSAVRHLRRREYQDMMYSMKAAGLNPMLASGATPGHSAVSAGATGSSDIGSGMAKGAEAGTSAKKAPSEIDVNTAKKGMIDEEKLNEIYGRANILQEYDMTKADIAATNQGILESGSRQSLMHQQSIQAGASAKELRAKELNLRLQNPALEQSGGVPMAPMGPGERLLRGAGSIANQGLNNANRNLDNIGGAASDAARAAASAAATSAKEFRDWLSK